MSYGLWHDAGFEALVSIVPPDAEIAPTSSLKAKSRGKAPGLLTPNGWVGYDWLKAQPNRANIDAWRDTGAGLGLRTDLFPAVDIDVLDAGMAESIEEITRRVLGDAPCRIGRAPKRLLLYRTDTPMPKRRIKWMDGEVEQAVEILGQGSQCVVQGIHPYTQQPYSWGEWHPVLLGAGALTEVTPAMLDTLFAEIGEFLTLMGYLHGETMESGAAERITVPQERLQGDLAAVIAAVQAIPNTEVSHPTRDDYLRMGYAIKGALADRPADAFEVWCAWAERWSHGVNTMETLESDWSRMKPPFEIGAQYLFDMAARFGDTSRTASKFEAEVAAVRYTLGPPVEASEEVRWRVEERPQPDDMAVMGSDAWLANRFLNAHGHEMRYCKKLGGWMYWNGAAWVVDELDLIGSWAARIGRRSAEDAAALAATPAESRSLGRWCNSERAVQQLLNYAGRHQTVVARIESFDTDPWLLNTPLGPVDLKTGELLPADPSRLLTKSTLVAPSYDPPTRWLAFLSEVTGGDADLQQYLQRLFGYALTGLTEEEMLAFFWGSGGNGKGTLLKTIGKVMGSYFETAAMETFIASEFDRHPTDLASLAGARLVVAQETQEGRAWDEAKIKTLTGSDPVKARFMRQDFFTYQPQFKLVFAGNHRPNMTSPDAAMLRRFHLIPFNVVPAIVDTHLKDRLTAEYPQILGWMITGCRMWQRDGLRPAQAVTASTREYFHEADPMGRWIEERCEVAPGAFVPGGDLFTDYRHWCAAESEDCGTQNAFGRALRKRGVLAARSTTTSRERGFQGLRLLVPKVDARAVMLLGEVAPTTVAPTVH